MLTKLRPQPAICQKELIQNGMDIFSGETRRAFIRVRTRSARNFLHESCKYSYVLFSTAIGGLFI